MLNNLNIAPRLYLLNVILAVFMVAIGVIGLRGMSGAVSGLQIVYENHTVPTADLLKMHRLLSVNTSEVLRAFQHDPEGKHVKLHDHPTSEHIDRIEANKKIIDDLWQKYLTKLSPDEKKLADDFAKKRDEYLEKALMPTIAALKNGNFSTDEVVGVFLKGNRKLGAPMDEAMSALIKNLDQSAHEEFDHAVASYSTARALSIGSNVAAVILGLILAWSNIRSITVPLNQMRTTIAEIEKSGDFTQRIPVGSNDEVGQAAKSFNELMGAMQTALRNILGSVEKVSDAAHTLSSASSQVAASSASQSEAASAMAATVEEVSVSINHVSTSASEALEISRRSGDLSSQGGTIIHSAASEMMQIADTVRETSGSIEALGQQSNQISSVVQVIKDVADQTNLLALNAAIEAARAGEQGRGFAVVADEVRKLAERTSKATEEITHMINTIQSSARVAVNSMSMAVTKVDSGVALARQAEDAINQIKDGSDKTISVVNDISSALVEQTSASNDISVHVEKVAQMTEENSAAASESAGSASHLEQLAEDMRATVSKFRI